MRISQSLKPQTSRTATKAYRSVRSRQASPCMAFRQGVSPGSTQRTSAICSRRRPRGCGHPVSPVPPAAVPSPVLLGLPCRRQRFRSRLVAEFAHVGPKFFPRLALVGRQVGVVRIGPRSFPNGKGRGRHRAAPLGPFVMLSIVWRGSSGRGRRSPQPPADGKPTQQHANAQQHNVLQFGNRRA